MLSFTTDKGGGGSSKGKGKGGGFKKQLVIMDEVDGMGGSDRGGIQELILLIKKSKVPILAICNDRQHQKIRRVFVFLVGVGELFFNEEALSEYMLTSPSINQSINHSIIHAINRSITITQSIVQWG